MEHMFFLLVLSPLNTKKVPGNSTRGNQKRSCKKRICQGSQVGSFPRGQAHPASTTAGSGKLDKETARDLLRMSNLPWPKCLSHLETADSQECSALTGTRSRSFLVPSELGLCLPGYRLETTGQKQEPTPKQGPSINLHLQRKKNIQSETRNTTNQGIWDAS